ncbi:zinc finger [Seminavis robusta]|uniref:Zinc finger n=1 Tax=Seminavis robusta TaxID=568900 RepID=A0A9N8DT56_9STRA|nr:zinc finger [Seminavis robusta]|eukprot:Sro324_g117500.1 zinc finger (481) ;mRNA; f:18887-20329
MIGIGTTGNLILDFLASNRHPRTDTILACATILLGIRSLCKLKSLTAPSLSLVWPSSEEKKDKESTRNCGTTGTAGATEPNTGSYSPIQGLPEDILLQIFCDHLNSPLDRFNLQCVNKRFQEISESPQMMKKLQILPPIVNARTTALDIGVDVDAPTSSASTSEGSIRCFLQNDTPITATKRFLPFAQAGNPDAIFLLGLIATYVEDDIHTGVAIFASTLHQVSPSHARSQAELANILLRQGPSTKQLGLQIMQQIADSSAHPHVLLGLTNRHVHPQPGLVRSARKETETIHHIVSGLVQLIDQKPVPPHHRRLKLEKCINPHCYRRGYHTGRRAQSRHWLKTKAFTSADQWETLRNDITCMQTTTCAPTHHDLLPDNVQDQMYRVPPFHRCNRCRAKKALYCSRSCQLQHWQDHKPECRRLQHARVNAQGIAQAFGLEGDPRRIEQIRQHILAGRRAFRILAPVAGAQDNNDAANNDNP